MPSSTRKQARLMAMCAHQPEREACRDIPQKIAREFNEADRKTGIPRKPRGKAGKSKT